VNIVQTAWYVHQLRRRFYRWNSNQLAAHHEKRLAHLLHYVRNHSPYYSRLLADRKLSLADIPVMDKAIMMEHFDTINTAGLKRDPLVSFRIRQEKEGQAELYSGLYSVGLSSGTSGNKVLTVLSAPEREAYGCLLFARNGIPAAIKNKRILFALRINNPAFMEVTRFGVTMIHVDYTKLPSEMIRLICEKKLNILAGPPSLLSMLGQLRGQIDHPIEALISYAEVLDPYVKRELERVFSAPVVQIYQGAEGFIGSTCRAGNLHLNEDVLYVEEVDADDPAGKVKSLLITDLYRKTQPMIRYALKDLVEFDPIPCSCGSSFRVIAQVHGRSDDLLHLKAADGTLRYLFPDYVCRAINQASDDIVEFQACQNAPGTLEVRLVLQPCADREAVEMIIRENIYGWSEKSGGEPPVITFTDTPPQKNPRSHKMIRVVRNSQ
jgi:putative adenylate-forming enzyme